MEQGQHASSFRRQDRDGGKPRGAVVEVRRNASALRLSPALPQPRQRRLTDHAAIKHADALLAAIETSKAPEAQQPLGQDVCLTRYPTSLLLQPGRSNRLTRQRPCRSG